MKRLLSLVLSLALLFAFVSVSFAALTVGGNFRGWYQLTNNDETPLNPYTSTFRFDRLALTFSEDLSAINGFKSEIQFRNVRNDADYAGGTSGKYGTDLRIDSAYYFQKAMLFDGDEFDAGVVTLPFNSSSYNAILVESLAHNVANIGKDSGTPGIKYSGTVDQFDFSIAAVNANPQYDYNTNTSQSSDGSTYALRLGYAPIAGLKFGVGYANKWTDVNNSATMMVVDAAYNVQQFGLFVEDLSITPTVAGVSQTAGTGIYCEGSYQVLDSLKVYVGRAIQTSTGMNLMSDSTYLNGKAYFYDANGNFVIKNNWSVIGLTYKLAPKTALQTEYLKQDDGSLNKYGLGVRLRVDF